MNSTKLRKIILEELSSERHVRPRRRVLGLVDYLYESSDQNLLKIESEGDGAFTWDNSPQKRKDAPDPRPGTESDPKMPPGAATKPDAAPAATATPAAPSATANPAAPAADAADDADAGGAPAGGTDSGGPPEEVAADPDNGSGPERDVDGPGDSLSQRPVEIPTDEDLKQDKLNADVINYIDSISTNGDPAGTSESRSRPIGTSLLKLLYHD